MAQRVLVTHSAVVSLPPPRMDGSTSAVCADKVPAAVRTFPACGSQAADAPLMLLPRPARAGAQQLQVLSERIAQIRQQAASSSGNASAKGEVGEQQEGTGPWPAGAVGDAALAASLQQRLREVEGTSEAEVPQDPPLRGLVRGKGGWGASLCV